MKTPLHRHPTLPFRAAAFLLLLGACGGDTANTDGTANAEAGSQTAVSLADVNPCGGFTAADAEALLGLPAADLEHDAGKMEMEGAPPNAFTCGYTSRTDFSVSLSFVLRVEPSASAAAEELAGTRASMSAVSPVEPLPGVGDEAYWFPSTMLERTLARKGNVWIDVLMPGDKDGQRRVAEAALRGL